MDTLQSKRLRRALLGALVVIGLASPAYSAEAPTKGAASGDTKQSTADSNAADEADDPARGGPSCQVTVAPAKTYWGGELTITARKPGRFGPDRGTVSLHESRDPNSRKHSLALSSWDERTISARMPVAPPDATVKEFLLSVTRANKPMACGFVSMDSKDNVVEALDSTLCVFTVSPQSVQWGETLTLNAQLAATGFGRAAGTVELRMLDNSGSAPLADVVWQSETTIKVTLPQTKPSVLANALEYNVGVKRAGESDPCGFQPVAVLPDCVVTAVPATVEWGKKVTLRATLASAGSGFGQSEGTVRLEADGKNETLSHVWTDAQIEATLPAARPPQFQPDRTTFQITVTRAGAATSCGWADLTVLPVIPCAVAPFAAPVNWGQTMSVDALLGQVGVADFGSDGTLHLGKGSDSVPLTVTEWRPERITASLPSKRPDHLPQALMYELSVTREGGSQACASVPLIVLPLCEDVGKLLEEAWAVSDGRGGTLPLGTTKEYALGPADWSPHFQVQQQAAAGNPLIESLSMSGTGIEIRLGFFAGGNAQSHDFSAKHGALNFDGPVPPLDRDHVPQLQVLPHPDIIPAFGDGPTAKAWTISLEAEVTVPGCALTLLDLTLTLQQMPLVIPQIAAWFMDDDFGGSALVMVAADDAMIPGGLPDPFMGIYDAKTDFDTRGRALRLAQLARLTGTLTGITDGLTILSEAFAHVPPELRRLPVVGDIEALADLISKLNDGRMVALTRNATILHEDVYRTYGDWWFEQSTFHRTASSLVLAGLGGYTGVDVLTGIPPAPPWECCFDWSGYHFGDGLITSWPELGDWNDRVEESGWCRTCPPF